MSNQHNEQPSATPAMTQTQSNAAPASTRATNTTPARPENSFVRHASEKIVDSAEEQIGEQGVTYVTENAPQDIDDVKAKAQGMWAKYCGCFSSLS